MEKIIEEKLVYIEWSRSQYSEVSRSDIAIKGMLVKICYFTSMYCIIFSNQIVLCCFVLFCFHNLCVELVRNTLPPPLALRELILVFLSFFSVFSFIFFS